MYILFAYPLLGKVMGVGLPFVGKRCVVNESTPKFCGRQGQSLSLCVSPVYC